MTTPEEYAHAINSAARLAEKCAAAGEPELAALFRRVAHGIMMLQLIDQARDELGR